VICSVEAGAISPAPSNREADMEIEPTFLSVVTSALYYLLIVLDEL
jgi:hypothetical protein